MRHRVLGLSPVGRLLLKPAMGPPMSGAADHINFCMVQSVLHRFLGWQPRFKILERWSLPSRYGYVRYTLCLLIIIQRSTVSEQYVYALLQDSLEYQDVFLFRDPPPCVSSTITSSSVHKILPHGYTALPVSSALPICASYRCKRVRNGGGSCSFCFSAMSTMMSLPCARLDSCLLNSPPMMQRSQSFAAASRCQIPASW